MKFKRVFTIVVDSCGFGSAEDSYLFDDEGADTIGNLSRATGGIKMDNLKALGMGNLHNILGVNSVSSPNGYYLKMEESSVGKDTMTGHWEIMGLYVNEPFITFTETGFPKELIDELEIGRAHV